MADWLNNVTVPGNAQFASNVKKRNLYRKQWQAKSRQKSRALTFQKQQAVDSDPADGACGVDMELCDSSSFASSDIDVDDALAVDRLWDWELSDTDKYNGFDSLIEWSCR
jgi:hypothetical protein